MYFISPPPNPPTPNCVVYDDFFVPEQQPAWRNKSCFSAHAQIHNDILFNGRCANMYNFIHLVCCTSTCANSMHTVLHMLKYRYTGVQSIYILATFGHMGKFTIGTVSFANLSAFQTSVYYQNFGTCANLPHVLHAHINSHSSSRPGIAPYIFQCPFSYYGVMFNHDKPC